METNTTAEQVAKNFDEFADKALTEPVFITKYGREYLVLISASEYASLKRRDRQVCRTVDTPDYIVDAIAKAKPPAEAEAYNSEYDPKASK